MVALTRNCDEIRDFLLEYLEKRLPPFDAWAFRFHLFTCPKCRGYLERYNTSVALSQNILDDPPPAELVNLTLEFLNKRIKPGAENADPGDEPAS